MGKWRPSLEKSVCIAIFAVFATAVSPHCGVARPTYFSVREPISLAEASAKYPPVSEIAAAYPGAEFKLVRFLDYAVIRVVQPNLCELDRCLTFVLVDRNASVQNVVSSLVTFETFYLNDALRSGLQASTSIVFQKNGGVGEAVVICNPHFITVLSNSPLEVNKGEQR